MPASMTAFAVREATSAAGTLTWELRSVNHRYLEVQSRLPEPVRALEPEVRERIAAVLGRGRVECTLRLAAAEAARAIDVDEALVAAIVRACHTVDDHLMNPARLNALEILGWPGVIRQAEPDREQLREPVLDLLDMALDDLIAARVAEGARIAQSLRERCHWITELVACERGHAAGIGERLRARLLDRLSQLSTEYDPGRLEQEIAYQAQRLDVSEELDRIDSHVTAVEAALATDEPVGRRLDFLLQECNREANTLGSKAADTERAHATVELKVAIEQMREQVQNLE